MPLQAEEMVPLVNASRPEHSVVKFDGVVRLDIRSNVVDEVDVALVVVVVSKHSGRSRPRAVLQRRSRSFFNFLSIRIKITCVRF